MTKRTHVHADGFHFRTMKRGEVDLAVDWAASEGWNPGLDDAACFHAADPGGFLIGLVGDDPVAVISVVRYGASFAFLGFYIVRPDQRGKGYGLRIWNAGMAALEGRNVGLDGVVDQQDNYRKSGFRLVYRNIRYQGTADSTREHAADIVPLASLDFDSVARYDRAFFPDDRTTFLQHWIAQPRARAAAVLEDHRIAGYGVMRECRNGYKVGPLFADRPELADRLFAYFRSHARANAPLFLDIPDQNPAALDLVTRHGMHPVFETARMYTAAFPELPMDRLFGVTSFELG